MVKNVVSESVKEKGLILAKSYSDSIWTKYAPVIDYVYAIDDVERNSLSQFSAFVRESENFMKIDKLVKALVYSNSGDVLYDSKNKNFHILNG